MGMEIREERLLIRIVDLPNAYSIQQRVVPKADSLINPSLAHCELGSRMRFSVRFGGYSSANTYGESNTRERR